VGKGVGENINNEIRAAMAVDDDARTLVNKKNDTDPKEAGAVNVKYTPYS
jgi:hypothetical protein